MAARNLAPLRTLNRDVIPIMGSFAPNGVLTVVASSRKGCGWSVARTSAGLFTITFTDKYNNLLCFQHSIRHPTAIDLKTQAGVYTAANKTITIAVLAIAVATDVTADANARIDFVAWFSNTAQTPNAG